MNAGCLDGFKIQPCSRDKTGFHAAFAAHPENLVARFIEYFGNGQRRIHSAASPACANQQSHWFDSFPEF